MTIFYITTTILYYIWILFHVNTSHSTHKTHSHYHSHSNNSHIKHKCIHNEIIKNHLNHYKKNIVKLKYNNHPYDIKISSNNDNIRRKLQNTENIYGIDIELSSDVYYIKPPQSYLNDLSLDTEYNNNNNNYFELNSENNNNDIYNNLHISKNSITNTMKPIRIVPYWNYLNEKLINKPNDLLFVKQLVSACINYINKFVYVEPVVGPLYHKKYCSKNVYIQGQWQCVKYWNGYDTCGTVKIPDEHFERVKIYNIDKSGKYKEFGGPGVGNADFILYVSAHDDSETDKKYCKGLVAGWSMACAFDQYGRPIAAAIQLCTHLLNSQDWNEDIETTLHELMHGMIMSGLWDMFWDKQRNRRYSLSNILDKNKIDDTIDGFISTPVVKNLIREHLNCGTAQGAPVKGGHFSEWYLNTELMIPVNYQGRFYTSSILLGLMIDSGWYGIDMDYAEPFRWGYQKGCEFWLNDCINKNTHKSNDNDIYWCDESAPKGCTSDYQSPADCQIFTQSIPLQFQYFDNIAKGGYSNTKYCPFRVPWKIEEYCVLKTGNTNSRCIPNKSFNNQLSTSGDCFNIECHNFDSNKNKFTEVKIFVGNDIINCNENNENQWINVKSSIVNEIKCPLINNVCVSKKPLSCKWGFYSNKLNKCLCSVGFTGIYCEKRDKSIVLNAKIYTKPTPKPTQNPTYIPTLIPTKNPSIKKPKPNNIDLNEQNNEQHNEMPIHIATSEPKPKPVISRYVVYQFNKHSPTTRLSRVKQNTPRPQRFHQRIP